MKAFWWDIDAGFAVVAAADDNRVAFFDVSEFDRVGKSVLNDDNAVHPAFTDQDPVAVDLEIFRKNGGCVKIFRDNAVHGGGLGMNVRRTGKMLCVKVRWDIPGNLNIILIHS